MMNDVSLIGKFTKEFEYSHTTNSIIFYTSILEVQRISSVSDYIPIVSQNNKIDLESMYYVHGDLRVFNRRGHSKYYVYTDFIYDVSENNHNSIELIGKVNSASDRRKTPLGSFIKDVMLSVTSDSKTFNIPLIFWNGLSKLELYEGQELHIKGRLQSRSYIKNNISRQIIEVSVNEVI